MTDKEIKNEPVYEETDEMSNESNEVTNEVSEDIIEDSEINNLKKELDEAKDKALRTFAEFDNFRKRTAKEKETLYNNAVADTVADFIPVLDNLERAIAALPENADKSFTDGLNMTVKIFKEVFAKIGVEEIKALGEEFNPDLHCAVMHVEDENVTDNTIVDEFQKGYKFKDRVIRYSTVKVAN